MIPEFPVCLFVLFLPWHGNTSSRLRLRVNSCLFLELYLFSPHLRSFLLQIIFIRHGCMGFYNGWKPGIEESIINMVANASGIRDTSRVLKISQDKVISTLKKRKNS
jgi:hypothetical protein